MELPQLTSLEGLRVVKELHRSNENVVSLVGWKESKEDVMVVMKRVIVRNGESLSKFEDEVALLCSRDLFNCERILTPLAVLRAPPSYAILLPRMRHGSVRDAIHVQQGEGNIESMFLIAQDMCDGLEVLHSRGILHRDVKLANYLLDEGFRAYLTDFGSAVRLTEMKVEDVNCGIDDGGDLELPSCKRTKRVATTADETQPGIAAPSGGFHKQILEGTTLLYSAPEVLRNNFPTTKSDIYSLGITLGELFMKTIPYDGIEKACGDLNTVVDASYSEHSLIAAITHDHLRPLLSGDILNRRFSTTTPAVLVKVIQLIRSCWDPNPDIRPSAGECGRILREIASEAQIDIGKASMNFPQNGSSTSNGLDPEVKKKDKTSLGIPASVSTNATIGGVGVFATSGKRGMDKMEDRYTVSHSSISVNKTKQLAFCTVVGLFDGHGGANAAEHCSQVLPAMIHRAIRDNQKEFKHRDDAMRTSFMEADRQFRFPLVANEDASGTTALVAAIWNDGSHLLHLSIANAGDCRAVLCRDVSKSHSNGHIVIASGRKYEVLRLTKDHLANDPEERARVERLGGKITVDAKGKSRVQGHIQVTRSIGDKVVKSFGVTAEPEIHNFELRPEQGDHFVIIATDGVWDALTDEDAVQCVLDTAKEPGLAAKRVGAEAFGRGSDDNITTAVIFLSPNFAKNLR